LVNGVESETETPRQPCKPTSLMLLAIVVVVVEVAIVRCVIGRKDGR